MASIVTINDTADASSGPSSYESPEQILAREEAATWLMRQQSADFSAKERDQFEAWRTQHPMHDRAYREVSAVWRLPEMDGVAKRLATTATVSHLVSPQRPRKRRLAYATAMAASLLLGVAWWAGGGLTTLVADYATAIGEQRVVTLPDHSIARLNTNTAVDVQYSPNERRVRLLRGEASFSVEHDPESPFVVESRGLTVTAVGTEFLVRKLDDDVRVTVLSGSVAVADTVRAHSNDIRLARGEQLSVGPQGAGSITNVDLAAEASWMQGRLVFVGAPLTEVIQELNRYYPGVIVIWNPALHAIPVTGVYHLSDPSRILTILADSLKFEIVRLTDMLVIFR